ncbi:AMP-binding protein [Sporichthya polymorpha]|uniref:AMP-binding protein n=1 Tax=Sporichthya polymorpha TaxID=35751 RepID=UPI0003708C04|nr:AMP-binding protein [Sporichthya polymorpha]
MGRIEGGWTVGPQTNVVDVVANAAQRFGNRTWLELSGVAHSFTEVWERSLRVARGLRELGVGPGDTVAAVLDTSVDAVAVWFGANALGAIWVPVNTAYKGEYLRHQLADSGAGVVVAEPDHADRVLAVADELPELRVLVQRGGEIPAGSSVRIEPIEALTQADALPAAEALRPAPGDLALLIYTSGTTGPSKGCMLSHNYVCNVARGSMRNRVASDVLWSPLPLFHLNAAATTVLASAMLGNTAAIFPRFSLSNFWPEIHRTGATVVTLLGMMIPLIAKMDDTPELLACKGQIRVAGGAPYTPETAQIWHERFGAQHVGSSVFGLTETTFLTWTPEGVKHPWGSAGTYNDDFDVRIFDDNDNELPVGEVGEIVARPLRPYVMFSGYWRRPEATQAVMRNMWFHTGDLGRFDENGWLWFVDRKKDYLRRGGENISSMEVEGTFRKHPAVADVAAHAVPSDLSEDELKITVVLREGQTLDPAELCRWSLDQLPYFAVPRYIEFRDDLPRNPTNKVLKYQLRDEGVTATTWDRNASDIVLSKR